MPPRLNLKGRRFGLLTCLEDVGRQKGRVLWRCQCDCGNEINATSSNLKNGHTQSCGCIRTENLRNSISTHGLSTNGHNRKTRLYGIWIMMRQRCLNPKNKGFNRYGGRGITICQEWEDYEKFHDWAYSHGYESHLTLERRNNNGPYSPDNCRWATQKEQSNNTRRNRHISFRGKIKTLSQWGEITGLGSDVIRCRIDRYGWSIEKALTTPSKKEMKAN
jgi:hypothetical protein